MTSSMTSPLLVSLPNWLGDAVFSTGLLAGLARLPRPPIVDVCGNATALGVAGGHRVVRRAILFERHGEHRYPRAFLALARSLRQEQYAAHVVLPSTPRAALFARAVGAPVRAGFEGVGRRFLLTHRVRRGRRGSEHLLDEYRRILEQLGLEIPPAEPEVTVSAAAAARGRELVAAHIGRGRRYGVLAPGATFGPTKRWLPERFARVAEQLGAAYGLAIVLVGGPGDVESAAAVRAALTNGLSSRFDLADLTGMTDLDTLAAVLEQAAVVVANDSGPLHLAGAVGVPAVGIFGSTEPKWTGPRGGRVVIAAERPPCAPCYQRRCGIGFVCLTRIEVEDVVRAAEAGLAPPERLAAFAPGAGGAGAAP
jgi:heptosyltransferase-2